ncbi:MAG TPA: NgoMIV family type II restriction endonuclease [Xanthobacteraceae bacterium]|jgi:hypothetical protein|nr:NgoMIV family type II restriction endonuclease [Xanthobacteraceae bacterium]
MKNSGGLITKARLAFQKRLLEKLLLLDASGVASNADSNNKASKDIALGIAERLASNLGSKLLKGKKLPAQTAGDTFEKITCDFIAETFPKLSALRPGKWEVRRINARSGLTIADFDQYSHLTALAKIAKDNPDLAIVLGNDYTIAPDVVVARQLETDESINNKIIIVDDKTARRAVIRAVNNGAPVLHASISCKWTMRSDRAQNARSEALNLIRNRKGRTPHIAVVTGEPAPSRLASLAIGTGDIDCVYHIALDELVEAVKAINQSEASDLLRNMIEGKRLKDIADLPLDIST